MNVKILEKRQLQGMTHLWLTASYSVGLLIIRLLSVFGIRASLSTDIKTNPFL